MYDHTDPEYIFGDDNSLPEDEEISADDLHDPFLDLADDVDEDDLEDEDDYYDTGLDGVYAD